MLEGLPANSLNVLMVLLSDYIHARVSECAEDSFFFNGEYLSEYMKKSVNKRNDTPGSAYIVKSWNSMKRMSSQGSFMPNF